VGTWVLFNIRNSQFPCQITLCLLDDRWYIL